MSFSLNTRTDAWVRTFQRRTSPAINLVCLPPAGCAASFYRAWGAELPADIAVRAVQYPGREDRFGETPIDEMAAMAEAVTEAVRPLFDLPVVLFGHSMGASIAYEVARRGEGDGRVPALFIASGHPAPHHRDPRRVHTGTDDELVAELRRYPDNGAGVLDSPELRELLLPTVRADYKLIETYELRHPAPIPAPVAVLRGVDDPDVDADKAAAWGDLAPGGALCARHDFPGGHFYLREQRSELLRVLTGIVGEQVRRPQRPGAPASGDPAAGRPR